MKSAILSIVIAIAMFGTMAKAVNKEPVQAQQVVSNGQVEELKRLLSNSDFCEERTFTKAIFSKKTIRSSKGKQCKLYLGALLAFLACKNAQGFLPTTDPSAKKKESSDCYTEAINTFGSNAEILTSPETVIKQFSYPTGLTPLCNFLEDFSKDLQNKCKTIFKLNKPKTPKPTL